MTGTGAAAREFKVVVRLDHPDPGLRPGLTCDAEIVTSERTNVLTVPLQSVVLRAAPPAGERHGRVSPGRRPGAVHAGDVGRDRRPRYRGQRRRRGRADHRRSVSGAARHEGRHARQSGDRRHADRDVSLLHVALYVEGISEALATIRRSPLRAALAGLAMAAAVATTAVVQTGLDGLARSAREASARAFGSDSFVIAQVAAGNLSRRELAEKIERNPEHHARRRPLPRPASRAIALLYAATAQRSAMSSRAGATFENATINGTQAALFDIRDVGIERGRPFTTARR